MMSAKKLFILASCTVCFFLSGSPVFSAQTFVVVSDVVFVREKPEAVSPLENMTMEELGEAYWHRTPDFPAHYYYGENIIGEVDHSNPMVVRTPLKVYLDNRVEETTAYVDLKKLWPEPPLSSPPVNRHMTKQDADVYLLPDSTSRKVLSLYQGEVVEVVGSLKVAEVSWSKARFCNEWSFDDEYIRGPKYEEQKGPYEEHCSRYGYIRTDVLFALLPGSVNESSLTATEVPRTVRNADVTLSEAERARLARDGFYVEEVRPTGNVYIDDMVDHYNTLKSSRFITSDLYLHVFHLIFDRMFQNIEEQKICPEIEELTKAMVSESEKELKSYTGDNRQIQKALVYNLFYFSVAAKLLDPTFSLPAVVQSDVQAVVEKILKAEGPLPSLENGIELGDEDFTQYRPRGHYVSRYPEMPEKEEDVDVRQKSSNDADLLERYFRTMMWYGRHAFLLSDDTKTMSAILISKALESSGEITRWKRINAALTRLIGKMDDWSPEDYVQVAIQIFGTSTPSVNNISKDAQIKSFK